MIDCDGATLRGRTEQGVLGPCRARNYILDGFYLAGSARPGDWNLIRAVSLTDVTQINSSLNTAALEDLSLHNLKRLGSSPLFLWGCVFRHVKLSGAISGIKLNRSAGPGHPAQHVWDEAMLGYYASVDWALDISQAKFAGGVSFEAIPGKLIRRNPANQILVMREKLEGQDWQSLEFGGTAIDIALSWFLSVSLFDSVVLAARAEPKWAKRDLAVLNMLRSEGIAEAD